MKVKFWVGWAAFASIAAVLFYQTVALSEPTERKLKSPAEAATAEGVTSVEAKREAFRGGGDRLVVHEWGTFTSFSGSDGVKLEFRPLVDNDLPAFVLDRARQAGTPNPFSKLSYRVFQRMETPVTYFYTDKPREVNVRVDFPKGLLTEFYPPVTKMAPAFDWKKPAPVGKSSLDWGPVTLIPQDRFQVKMDDAALSEQMHKLVMRKLLRWGQQENHYEYARETDSALILSSHKQPFDPKRPLTPRGDFLEKFLFYRGVGNFDLPLEMQARGGDRFELTNHGGETIRSLFLVDVDGEKIRFTKTEQIAGGETITLQQSAVVQSIGELSQQVVSALVDEGLYRKEAEAMVKTWNSSWFGEQGARLFYMLPRPMTDDLLPLTVSPQPNETVRVLVGRLEIMSPEHEALAAKLVAESAKRRAAHHKAKIKDAYPMPKEVLNLGRLAEPALVRIMTLTKDGTIRLEARQLLHQVEILRNARANAS